MPLSSEFTYHQSGLLLTRSGSVMTEYNTCAWTGYAANVQLERLPPAIYPLNYRTRGRDYQYAGLDLQRKSFSAHVDGYACAQWSLLRLRIKRSSIMGATG